MEIKVVLPSLWDFFTGPTNVLAIITILLIYSEFVIRRNKLPPGPIGLPFLGYLPFLGRQPHVTLSQLSKKYGDVMSFTICGTTVIHLHGHETIKEAFLTLGEKIAGRPQDFSFFQWVVDGKGIAQAEGPEWKEHRRFAIRTLRDFGFGKSSLEERVQHIADDILVELEKTGGKPYDPLTLLSNSTTNVICSLLLNHHYAMDDPEFVAFRNQIRITLDLLPGVDAFVTFPFARYVWKFTSRYKKLKETKENFHDLMKKHIQQHEETFDSSNLRDYVDVYLDERRKAKEEGTLDNSTFDLHRLVCIAFNLFFAGTETTTRTLHWALKIFMVHRDIQERVRKELDDVIGRERNPTWRERFNLPYTEAVISEILRYSSVLPIAPFHSTLEEVAFKGYIIPKRSTVMANLWSVHRDPTCWPEPNEFDPSRFLDQDGNLTKQDSLIPFSIGKRACPGESLARMEIFLFLTNILHRFNICPPQKEENQDIKYSVNLIRSTEPYKLSAIPRS